ncbi:asparagine synthase (glutamine-hydrolyzing) [Thermococcus kodakarensis KOD1]|uniref:Putative asparagine synthetase [glutamine-hydrolyzing] n=1 Tax=Thermococcus kodakarensis (strain ATCC BAA-918 / JCM 12380 / KOD1) TaxID=69014 RepID=Q5JIA2_THEKO|nr:asparagine synthase (glutamine-hydrolyzing) [Thermococcus kodakarensis]WCN29252.1 asparagine synthase (glutamine-hydrolyzing) [Thermococcus kodakarensis]WCN31551.1 asparagine synthase (glutamine-hydrolyzing) [Thermococcus kodakarensis]BAD85139.1 asparagine synthase (glutamine-hydrolyzing) [Thermococcus kodakarensis KOD1]
MCLIAGGMGGNLREKLIKMAIAGKHRGPESFGVWTDGGVLKSDDFSKLTEIPDGRIGLLQCRLAITGSKSFTQPFINDLALVHNGEIYNHAALREYLERRGVSFESDVDSEVVLRLIEFLREEHLSYPEIVKKLFWMLEGDYAVAFSDGERIYLFRDPLGIRPLYFSRNGLFASEKKVLWAVGEREVEPVQPGELVVLEKNGVRRARLFSLENLKSKAKCERKDPVGGVGKLLRYAVKNRVSKKTGVLFSGGLDSTLVAYLASQYSDVILYTAGTEDSPDIEWARKVADHFGWALRERTFEVEDVRDAVKRVMYAIEEPNPMNLAIGLPLYFASGLASSDGTRVLLSGQGADELFGGYAKYLERPELMEEDIALISERNLARDDKITMLNGVEGRYPFLALPVVSFALKLPLEAKIVDGTRKVILRKLALRLGIPEWIAEREKRAAQYGSRAQKLLEKIAREEGLTLREFAEKLFRETFPNAF